MRHSRVTAALGALVLGACSLADLDGLAGSGGTPEIHDRDGGPIGRDGGGADADPSRDGASKVDADAADDPAPCTRLKEGARCGTDGDCCSDNCYAEVCAGNDIGARCSSDAKCKTDNCFGDVCHGNDIGARCNSDAKCTSDNCYNEVCEGRTKGSRCRNDSKCDSKVCIDDICQ